MYTDLKSVAFFLLETLAFFYLVFSGPQIITNIPFLLVQVFGLLLIVWAVLSHYVNRHAHAAKLPKGAFLVMKGPYEIIRHPIYAGLLLIALSYTQGYFTALRLLVFIIFLGVMLLKINYEENLIEEHIKEYKLYREKTHKMIPYVF